MWTLRAMGTDHVAVLLACATVLAALQGCESSSINPPDEMKGKGSDQRPLSRPATGPLRVHPTNPRYFTDGSGKAIYLTGSHHWNNFQDAGEIGRPVRVFDYFRYLDFLTSHHHNFMRMWVSEGAINRSPYAEPLPYLRTGSGSALDGKPKFDVTRFNQTYFDRMRSRIILAGERGIYVGIMLFNGWSIYDHGYGSPWPFHPFNKDNNVNGIDGDPDGDGEGKEAHGLVVPAITARQEAYVQKVIDTVNDLDNVLYEISNETAFFSRDWQYHMIRFIRDYERTKPRQHPVGMTDFDSTPQEAALHRTNDALLSGPATWISPGNDGQANYGINPPYATGRKVMLSDTDHFFGIGGDHAWVWKTFTRGLNPIYMDPLDEIAGGNQDPQDAEKARMAMGHSRGYAERMRLDAMAPREDLCSTKFCLANPGVEYLSYLPFGAHWFESYAQLLPSSRFRAWMSSLNMFHRSITVDLGTTSGPLAVEWFNPITGKTTAAGTVTSRGKQAFTAPFRGDAVLYLASSHTTH